MKRVCLFFLFFIATHAFAQDVIVKQDGSTILSKVVEIGTTEVKYKKYSNQNGPTYVILKSEIIAINYENGEKDTFTTSPTSPSNAVGGGQVTIPFAVNPNLESDNLQLVNAFNSSNLIYSGDDKTKKRKALAYVFGLKEGSIIETPELKATLSMKLWHGRVAQLGSQVRGERTLELNEPSGFSFSNYQYRFVVLLTNKTDKTIYIDLSNCFVIQNNVSTPYYILSSTTITTTTRGNGNINVSAGTGLERIVMIPPKQSLALTPQNIGEGFTWETTRNGSYQHNIIKSYIPYLIEKGYAKKEKNYTILFSDLLRGEKIDIPVMENIAPLSTLINYSLTEDMSSTQNLHMDFYLRQVMGCKDTKATDIDYSQCPLIFFSSGSITDLIKT